LVHDDGITMYNGVIYCATSPSDKKYYGQTFHDFKSRKGRHFLEAINRDCQYAFHRALRKYGFENFKWEIIEKYSFDNEEQLITTLNDREIYWIEKDKTYMPEFGYNMKIGGFNGRHCQETKDKIRKKLLGVKHSSERRKHESESHIGQTAWNKGKKCTQFAGENNGMYGISVYDLWVKKYGKEEADKRKEARRIKLSRSLQGKNKGKTYPKNNESIKENTMTNSESQIINYFKQFAKMTSGNQKDFWDWKLENAQVLTHVKTDEIRDQYPEIDEWIKNNKVNIVQKQCFRNAGQLCINVDGVDYVEGEILYHGIPIEHAWNKIDGKYFDITKDILFPHNSDYAEYVKIIELDVKEYSRFLFKYKHWGGFILEKYLKDNHIKESFYPRLFEDGLDAARERMFNMHSAPQKGHRSTKDKQEIVGKVSGAYGPTNIIKNPKTLKGIDDDSRGVIDKEGNLYVLESNVSTHTEMINVLEKNGLIKNVDKWWKKIPTNFVTIQRIWGEDKFAIGESNEVLLKNYNGPAERKRWNMPSIREARKTFMPFILAAREKHPNFKFYEYVLDEINEKIRKGKVFEGSEALSKYYERKFGIPRRQEFQYVDEDEEEIVAKVEGTPIIKNPKSFEGFDNGVRIIVDKSGNVYAAKYDGMFNHGMMANALIRAGQINTPKYNEDAASSLDMHGIYEDQKNFLLLMRLHNTDKIIQSDTFEWEGKDTELLIKRLKIKQPQFEFYLRYSMHDEIE